MISDVQFNDVLHIGLVREIQLMFSCDVIQKYCIESAPLSLVNPVILMTSER